jgi:hypothetical protein
MPTANALLTWFDSQLASLPTQDLPPNVPSKGTTVPAVHPILKLIDEAPIGITHYKLRYRSIPLRRSGPKGWTYFPLETHGSRLARLSYHSPKPNVYVTALVKLIDHETHDDTDFWTVSDYAIVTVDNLTGHGKVEMRDNNPANKRRKLCIHH